MEKELKCPFASKLGASSLNKTRSNRDWWPNQLNLGILHQNSPSSNRYMKLMQTCACCSFPNSAMLVESLESLQKSRAVCAVGQ